ncbi:alpha/beta fold hydrolase [Sediminibacterium sp. C3]|uniref:alpha/beta fold hydrolase n=1 Tax=Sediminibacterium sp. C3 TaxID=1267211 RepID=UPI00042242D0|nr:alpha/beta hydrolase [Sediminibacterium sp. C3]
MKKKLLVFVFSMVSIWFSAQAQGAFQVKVIGKGNPVLLFPGFGCTGEIFEETVKALSTNNECHVFTFAGFGGVPAIEMPWLPNIKDQVVTYVKSKKLNKPVIIGHSLGGTLGLWLAATDQSLFKKVIAVDALPCNGAVMMPNYDASTIVYESPYSKQMLQQDTASFRKQALQQVGFMMLNKEKQAKVVDMMLQADRKTYVYGYVDLLKLDLRNDIAGIQLPVVVLAATHPNKAMVEKTYNEQYAKLGNKVIHYADKAAHFVMYDQPEWYINKIKENIQ